MVRMLVKSLVAAATAASMATALAHEDAVKPRFGGTVASAAELGFELVAQGDGAALYVEDHGKPVPTEGMSGKLTVLKGSAKREAALTAAGGNKLEAQGIALGPGAKAVATLTLPSRKVVTVRFAVK
ncbi:MAG TPA: hypothetical protein VFZ93_14775 [Albitalea sp.]